MIHKKHPKKKISALHGTGVGHLYESIHGAYESATRKLTTPRLTALLEDIISTHPPPMVGGRRVKLRYAHMGGHNPPRIVIHGNSTDKLPSSYVRYLENAFRRELELSGRRWPVPWPCQKRHSERH